MQLRLTTFIKPFWFYGALRLMRVELKVILKKKKYFSLHLSVNQNGHKIWKVWWIWIIFLYAILYLCIEIFFSWKFFFFFLHLSFLRHLRSLKGTVSLFWPRGPELALTFLRDELIIKILKWGWVMEEMVKMSGYFLNDPVSFSNDMVSF